jgi:DUF971 family protein
MNPQSRPKDISIERREGIMTIMWMDGRVSHYPLRWLRANCPCATCKEVRNEAASNTDMLTLNAGPTMEPSTEIANAEIVGNYAIRLVWADGHDSGIYPFTGLRACTDVIKTEPDGSPKSNYDFSQPA